ncbi:hypothetical protein BH11PSE8_BH11PSE8_23220 [soil metagenome]
MFEMPISATSLFGAPVPPPAFGTTPMYRGPERRSAALKSRHLWAATLDEIDYGMLLLTDEMHAVHVNHAARLELDGDHPLHLIGRELHARRPKDVQPLQDALHNAAHRGLRKLLTVGEGQHRVSISIVPLRPVGGEGNGHTTLVWLGKRDVCEPLSVQGYARCYGLTAAETRVLIELCAGARPGEAAATLGVKISTVRTQIGNIRLKTGAESIRALVRQVAVLPPMVGALRFGAGSAEDGRTSARGDLPVNVLGTMADSASPSRSRLNG